MSALSNTAVSFQERPASYGSRLSIVATPISGAATSIASFVSSVSTGRSASSKISTLTLWCTYCVAASKRITTGVKSMAISYITGRQAVFTASSHDFSVATTVALVPGTRVSMPTKDTTSFSSSHFSSWLSTTSSRVTSKNAEVVNTGLLKRQLKDTSPAPIIAGTSHSATGSTVSHTPFTTNAGDSSLSSQPTTAPFRNVSVHAPSRRTPAAPPASRPQCRCGAPARPSPPPCSRPRAAASC